MQTKRDHQPCWCGNGSDNTTINEDGSGYCYTCPAYVPNYEAAKNGGLVTMEAYIPKHTDALKYAAIPDRKISEETCRKYGVQISDGGDKHYYPYHSEHGVTEATKIRHVHVKSFFIEGNIKEAGLFGQAAFKAGGKYITVVEGELDALAAHQMTGNKWPVVSLKNGAGGAVNDIKGSLEYLESFETVVLCFDSDAAGQAKVRDAAKLLAPGKAKIMRLPEGFKDACDMLKANKASEFIQSFWNAEKYIPSGIVNLSESRSKYFDDRPDIKGMPYPWNALNEKTYGMRKGELVTWTGGSGGGKSSIVRELEHYIITSTGDAKVGVLALEENYWRTVDGILSIEANRKLHIPEVHEIYPKDKLEDHYTKLFEGKNTDRVFVHAHLGIQTFDDIMAKLRYMVVGCGCDYVVLDHLHMLIRAMNGSSEREIIDESMLRLRSLVEETHCSLHLISHLSRVSGSSHERGGQVEMSHLRGSQSIGQLSDMIIAAERDQQAEDDTDRNRMRLRVIKNRLVGKTGPAGCLRYDDETGRLIEVDEDVEFEQEEF